MQNNGVKRYDNARKYATFYKRINQIEPDIIQLNLKISKI